MGKRLPISTKECSIYCRVLRQGHYFGLYQILFSPFWQASRQVRGFRLYRCRDYRLYYRRDFRLYRHRDYHLI